MENIKANIKGVVGSSGNGIPLTQLENDYFNVTQTHLNYRALGFNSLLDLLKSIPDLIKVVDIGGKKIIKINANNTPECLSRLLTVINTTSIKKQRMNTNRNIGVRRNIQCQNPPALPRPPVCHIRPHVNEVNVKAVPTNKSSSETYDSLSNYSGSEEIFDTGTWFVRPEIRFLAYQKQVRLLGVQAGYAVVAADSYKRNHVFFQSTNIKTVFPGTIVLWQPPVNDKQRTKNAVDFNTCFPATIIKRVDKCKIQVRILGLLTIIVVGFCDLFEMPRLSGQLGQLVRSIQTRDITMVQLSIIPDYLDIWDMEEFPGTYTVLCCTEDGGSILEDTEHRGTFLNIDLLRYMRDKMVQEYTDVKLKTSFLRHMEACVDRCLGTLRPYYERLMDNGDQAHSVHHPLRIIYHMDECMDAMLLGCKVTVGMDELNQAHRAQALSRMKASKTPMSLYCFDDSSCDISVSDQSPLQGVYIINQNYTESMVYDADALRFHTKLLLVLPSTRDLATDLCLVDN